VTGVVFHPLAERELIEAARFYESRAANLGGDFLREVEHTLAQIVATPEAGSLMSGTIRRRLVRRFPFAILYQAGIENVSVIALMHLRRRPGYWKRRVRDTARTRT
jgi:plasmid stabilization system protein ParE